MITLSKGKIYKILAAGSLILSCFFSTASQASIISPTPSYGADDGTELFTNAFGNGFSVENFDFAEISTGTGFEFGFYFENNPSTLISIFDSSDSSTSGLQSAIIDFNTGFILDQDAIVIQSAFSGAGNFGFYLAQYDTLGVLVNVLFTQSALNPAGIDFAGSLPSTSIPNEYLIGFEAGDSSANGQLLYLGTVFGVRAIPAPSVLCLFTVSCLILANHRRKAMTA